MDAILDCVDEIALDGLDGKYFSVIQLRCDENPPHDSGVALKVLLIILPREFLHLAVNFILTLHVLFRLAFASMYFPHPYAMCRGQVINVNQFLCTG